MKEEKIVVGVTEVLRYGTTQLLEIYEDMVIACKRVGELQSSNPEATYILQFAKYYSGAEQ